MAWERRGNKKFYYRSRKVNGRVVREYIGRGYAAAQAATEAQQRRLIQERDRSERAQLATLDSQNTELATATTTLAHANLLIAGYHRPKRQWRKRRHGNNTDNGGTTDIMITTELTGIGDPKLLETLVRRGMNGDCEVVPAIRQMLDQVPALWENAGNLATQVERSWLQAITADDLVSREVLERQLAVMKTALAGPAPTMLETLLVDRIAACWLAVQQAELSATKRLQHNGVALSNAQENRLDKVHRRFLTAVRELARVRKLLVPEQKLQVNIGTQQIVA